MAKTFLFLSILAFHFIFLSLLSSFATISVTGDYHNFAKNIDTKKFGLKKEKLSYFRVYWHDIVSGRNPTAVAVVPPVANSSTSFGFITMIDDPLTLGPELNTKLVGRAQGFYASASQKQIGLLMVQNFAFMEGKYNGSTITVLGRNEVFTKVREMPIVGGSGHFRFARGYVEASTHKFDLSTGDATVVYDCYVLHY